MGKKIIWTPEAEQTFTQVVDYLHTEWTDKEVRNFITLTDTIVRLIAEYPHIGRHSLKKDSREVIVTKHNLLLYKEYVERIDLISFFDTRQHPRKKPKAK